MISCSKCEWADGHLEVASLSCSLYIMSPLLFSALPYLSPETAPSAVSSYFTFTWCFAPNAPAHLIQ